MRQKALQGAFEHFRFRKHDLAAFHLLDPLELNFTFHRPMRFLDMEGGSAIFADPSDISDRYHTGRDSWFTGKPQKVHRAQHDHEQVLRRVETRLDDWGEIVSGYKRGAREIIPRDHRDGASAPKS